MTSYTYSKINYASFSPGWKELVIEFASLCCHLHQCFRFWGGPWVSHLSVKLSSCYLTFDISTAETELPIWFPTARTQSRHFLLPLYLFPKWITYSELRGASRVISGSLQSCTDTNSYAVFRAGGLLSALAQILAKLGFQQQPLAYLDLCQKYGFLNFTSWQSSSTYSSNIRGESKRSFLRFPSSMVSMMSSSEFSHHI